MKGRTEPAGGGHLVFVLLGAVLTAAILLGVLMMAAPGFAQEGEDEDQMVQPRVVGGEGVPNGKYRFVSALLDTRRGSSPDRQQFCGGTLIDRNSVLTAAHCVYDRDSNGNIDRKIPVRYLRVTVGRTVLNSDQGQVRQVTRVTVHPRYNDNTRARDVAVLQLKSTVNTAPIRLAAPGTDGLERAGRSATVAGWGNTIRQTPPYSLESDSYPNRLQEGNVPLVSDSECGDVYEPGFASGVQVCAGRENRDTCQGDSGGPMWVDTSKGRRQIGITSYGAGCGADGYPGVYTEVNARTVYNFIQDARR